MLAIAKWQSVLRCISCSALFSSEIHDGIFCNPVTVSQVPQITKILTSL
jgi:hypothetical protein